MQEDAARRIDTALRSALARKKWPGLVCNPFATCYPSRKRRPENQRIRARRRKGPGGLTGLQNRVVPPGAGWKVRLLPFSANLVNNRLAATWIVASRRKALPPCRAE